MFVEAKKYGGGVVWVSIGFKKKEQNVNVGIEMYNWKGELAWNDSVVGLH